LRPMWCGRRSAREAMKSSGEVAAIDSRRELPVSATSRLVGGGADVGPESPPQAAAASAKINVPNRAARERTLLSFILPPLLHLLFCRRGRRCQGQVCVLVGAFLAVVLEREIHLQGLVDHATGLRGLLLAL